MANLPPASTQMALLGVLWGIAGMAPNTFGSPIISGTVTQNGSLFTYSYSIDNTSGPGPIKELAVLISSTFGTLHEVPLSYTEPPGWSLTTGFSGSIGSPPYNEVGEFWDWGLPYDTDPGLPVGQSATGFSFTTTVGPTMSTGNNYFVYCTLCADESGNGVVEYGHIVAPDLMFSPPPTTSPEPAFFVPLLLLTTVIVWPTAPHDRNQAASAALR